MRSLAIGLAILALGACAGESTPKPSGPEGRLSLSIAPLTLSTVTDADYTIAVTSGPGGGGPLVWTRSVKSSQYGDGAGGVSYVGTCDASESINTVTLTLTALYDGASAIPTSKYQNPTPVSLEAPCNPNTDTPVVFNLTIARSAEQGFFDVAVEFQDIFCSAKLDCVDALLHRPGVNGERDLTAVVAFACTGSPTGDTHLYFDDLLIDCEGNFPVFGRVRPIGQGNITPLANPGDYLYGAAVYRGNEQIANKSYWNVSLGLDETKFAANGLCTLRARATASRVPLTTTADGFVLPSGAIYPVIEWNVPLSNATGKLCSQHEVNGGNGVATVYHSDLPLFPGSGDTQLQHEYTRATSTLESGGQYWCISRAEVCNGVDDDCDGVVDNGVLSECGNCDFTCHAGGIGATGDPGDPGYEPPPNGGFTPGDMVGTTYDPQAGGLVIDRVAVTSNFLWVPNTAESTLSKWDAGTNTELARYYVGYQANACNGKCCWDTGCNMPSRVVVDARGDVYVANRGFGIQGSITKIAGSPERCIDRNNNGVINTASSNVPFAWGMDECVLWTAPVGAVDSVLRSIAIDRGDAANPEGYPWVGGYNSRKVYKLDPDTGAVLVTLDIPVAAYGAVVTADGTLWVSSLDSGGMARINTTTNVVSPKIDYPLALRGNCIYAYGITADTTGRIWLAGWTCNDALAYDPALSKWSRINTTGWGLNAGRGITVYRGVDAQNNPFERIYMAVGGDGQSHITWWDPNIFTADTSVTHNTNLFQLPAGNTGPSGVGADSLGNIWVAHHNTPSNLIKINPATTPPTVLATVGGPNRVYTYSDFTGSVRRLSVDQGSYVHEFTAACANPVWGSFSWTGSEPAGSSVSFSVRTAATTPGLSGATAVPIDIAPGATFNVGAAFTAGNITPQSKLAVTLTMSQGTASVSPVVQGFAMQWQCP